MSEEQTKEEKAKAKKDAAKLATKEANAENIANLAKIEELKEIIRLNAQVQVQEQAKESNLAVKKDRRIAKAGVVIELIKGDQWVDDLSGISLYRGFYNLVGDKDLKGLPKTEKSKTQDSGYVELKNEKRSTIMIPEIDEEKLVRVEKALRLGILKIYDEKKPTKYINFAKLHKAKVSYDDETTLGFKFNKEEDEDISNFLKLPIDSFKEEVVKIKSTAILEKIYDAEYAGTNLEAKARKEYVDILKKQIKEKGEGVGNIKSSFVEKVNITNG